MMTDTIAAWVQKEMVAGPFEKRPFKVFRVNPLMAVAQKDKVRPIMNLSAPKQKSFNDFVDENDVAKLEMSSARLFGNALVEAGKGAIFAKYDIKDAYKLIPGRPDQWHCFGFKWLGKYFYDVTTVFGSKSAPANFDCLPAMLVDAICTEIGVPHSIVHRQLDDVPIVSPSGSGWTEKFAEAYLAKCRELDIPLADTDPSREKAFGPGTWGTVLGVRFDSETMTWSWAEEKICRAIDVVDKFLLGRTCTLKETQILHGKLNDFAQMCRFMMGFRFHLIELLSGFENDENRRKIIVSRLKKDLWVWKKCIMASKNGLPIPDPDRGPPFSAIKFISDAAGAETCGADHVLTATPGDRGVASVGFRNEEINFVSCLKWPYRFLTREKDEKGTFLGSKSTLLESIGLLIPLLVQPNVVKNRYVILYVDNINVIYGWEKRYIKNDQMASIMIRCIHVLESLLECKIHVEHVGRMSTSMATLADHLSRASTTTQRDMMRIRHLNVEEVQGPLIDWLHNPGIDWDLPTKMAEYVIRQMRGAP
jgi:hypothetical protein